MTRTAEISIEPRLQDHLTLEATPSPPVPFPIAKADLVQESRSQAGDARPAKRSNARWRSAMAANNDAANGSSTRGAKQCVKACRGTEANRSSARGPARQRGAKTLRRRGHILGQHAVPQLRDLRAAQRDSRRRDAYQLIFRGGRGEFDT